MRIFLTFLIICVTSFGIYSNQKRIGENVSIKAIKCNKDIVIDGKLTEDIWKNPSYSNFRQKDPVEGKEPSQKTEIWIAYDEEALYVAAYLHDNPDSIVGQLSRRDTFNESDWFMFFLDSYNDKRTGYYFAINPAGSVADGTLFNDSWDDNSWNGVWESKTETHEDGWVVELKIPFTQIRFNEALDHKWGINFKRTITRFNEDDYMIMVPKTESGFVSHFATLTELKGIKPKQRFEILPYYVQKAQFLVHDADDPYYKSQQYKEMFGADLKLGLGSNLTLDATINPDFGQVEVDPAVINLSAFETYYDEKRPFFIEGSNMFLFGYGGSNNNWGFNWGNPDIFYSRRIGRSPQGSTDADGYVYQPSETRILGAAKITGKVGDNINVGIINATTERTFANIYSTDQDVEVEPLTNYSVFRAQREFNDAKYGIGLMGTAVIRDVSDDNIKNIVSRNAFVLGGDGWVTLDDNGTYVVTGYFAGSHKSGSKEYMVDLQRSSMHYFQRPDAKSFSVDSNRTSLSGFISRIALNKQKGNFYINSAIGVVSPGFNVNDAGFQFKTDAINTHLVLGYRFYEPDAIFHSKSFNIATARTWNFDGIINDAIIMGFVNLTFKNYWFFGFQGGVNPETYSYRQTRGGPLVKNPKFYHSSINISTDSRKKYTISLGVYGEKASNGTNSASANVNLEWKVSSSIYTSFGPFYEYGLSTMQWVDSYNDPTAAQTYKARYMFADLTQRTFGGNIRLNWTFSPTISLQLFVQPLLSVGDYEHYKALERGADSKTNEYGKFGNSTINYNADNDEYTVDADGNGEAPGYVFSDPDFNFKSLRGNLIFRWEFLPGSTFFLVWTHNKWLEQDNNEFQFKRQVGDLFKNDADNIFLAKINYWLNF